MVAAKAAVICAKSQYAPNPPNARKLMILAGRRAHHKSCTALSAQGPRVIRKVPTRPRSVLAIASTESTQSLSASAPNDGSV